jgi:FMN phosphatase YigB (HAD superfamily)
MGLDLGIVSNTFVNADSLERHLDQFGILDFFGLRMYSYQFDFRKPDSRIFKIAAERISQEPRNIMFVGDRLDTDIEGALKCGMYPVLKAAYTNVGKETPDGAWKIDQLSELPALIEKINSDRSDCSRSTEEANVDPQESLI